MLTLLTQMVLGRALAPAGFGLLALGLGLLRLVETVGTLGLHAAVIRFGVRRANQNPSEARATIFRGIRLAFVFGLIIGGATFLGAPFLAREVFHKASLTDIFRIVACGFPLATTLAVAAAATRTGRRARYAVMTREVGQPMVFLVLVLVALSVGLEARGAAVAAVLAVGVALAAALVIVARLFPRGETSATSAVSIKIMLAFSLPASLSGASRFLVSWTDRFVVGAYLPPATLGTYHAAAQLSAVLSTIAVGFGAMIAPMIAELAHAGELKRIRELYALSTKWTLTLAVPPAAVLLIAPAAALRLTFGSSYEGAAPTLALLAIGQLITVCAGSLGVLLVMTGRERSWAAVAAGAFLLNLPLSVHLVPRIGARGAAIATVISLMFLASAGTLVAKRALGVWPFNRRVGKTLALVCVTLLTARLAVPLLPERPLGAAIMLFAISSVVLFAAMLLSGIDVEEREALRWLRERITR